MNAVESGRELARAAERLGQIAEAARLKARALGRPVLAWATTSMARVDPAVLFDCAGEAAADRILWASPIDRFGLVGMGTAWTATADGADRFARAGTAWRSLLDGALGDGPAAQQWGRAPAVLGGFAFAPVAAATPEWAGYPAAALVLPRVCAVTTADETCLILATLVGPDAAAGPVDAELARCLDVFVVAMQRRGVAPDAHRAAGVQPRVIEERPSAEAWKRLVRSAVAEAREGRLTKVVLARAMKALVRRFDPAGTLGRLRARYPGCTLFAFARADRCFLGATPERLVRLQGQQVRMSAVAGSAPRGASEEEDTRLGETLLASAKNRFEHAVVVDEMRHALAGIGAAVSAAAVPALLKTATIQHLHTPLTAALRDRGTVLDLVHLLHPTAAVGGVPRAAALPWLAEHEGLDRGWYAGPVGWMDGEGNGEFDVAIRSALLRGREALLFAGCGIVGDSDPDQEYAESELKLHAVLAGLDGP